MRFNAPLKAVYQALLSRGEPKKVGLIALARFLVIRKALVCTG